MPLILGDYTIKEITGPVSINILSSPSHFPLKQSIIFFGDYHQRKDTSFCIDPDCYDLSIEFINILNNIGAEYRAQLKVEFFFESGFSEYGTDYDEGDYLVDMNANIRTAKQILRPDILDLNPIEIKYLMENNDKMHKIYVKLQKEKERESNSHMLDMINLHTPCLQVKSSDIYRHRCDYKNINWYNVDIRRNVDMDGTDNYIKIIVFIKDTFSQFLYTDKISLDNLLIMFRPRGKVAEEYKYLLNILYNALNYNFEDLSNYVLESRRFETVLAKINPELFIPASFVEIFKYYVSIEFMKLLHETPKFNMHDLKKYRDLIEVIMKYDYYNSSVDFQKDKELKNKFLDELVSITSTITEYEKNGYNLFITKLGSSIIDMYTILKLFKRQYRGVASRENKLSAIYIGHAHVLSISKYLTNVFGFTTDYSYYYKKDKKRVVKIHKKVNLNQKLGIINPVYRRSTNNSITKIVKYRSKKNVPGRRTPSTIYSSRHSIKSSSRHPKTPSSPRTKRIRDMGQLVIHPDFKHVSPVTHHVEGTHKERRRTDATKRAIGPS